MCIIFTSYPYDFHDPIVPLLLQGRSTSDYLPPDKDRHGIQMPLIFITNP